MKILSNFDTEFKERLYKQMIEKYGKDKVILITRDKIFLYMYILIPLVLYLMWLMFLIIIGFFWDWWQFNNIKWWIILFFIVFTFVPFVYKIVKRLIDYYMDFAIITPKEIVSYNQSWIFSRDSRAIDVDKIKTVSVDKKGFLKSLFNFWSIIFLSEWDDSGHWDIKLDFVHDPDVVRKKIVEIVEFGEGE